MSFLVSYGKNESKIIKYKERKNPTPSSIFENEGKAIIGDWFGVTDKEILSSGWEQNPDVLKKYDNIAINLISFNDEDCYICSDIYSQECLYYFHDEKNSQLYVSDDFWDIVKVMEPTFEMLDIDNIKARITLGGCSLNGETIIKGLMMLAVGTLVKYNKASNELRMVRREYLQFDRSITDINEAIEKIDLKMDKSIKDIKEKYGDVTYGLGLSGGLDSRLVLHYAMKNNMRIKCYNQCDIRPHYILKARSVKLAEKLAKVYHLPIKFVQWNEQYIDIIKKQKTKLYPNGPKDEAATDIYKYVPNEPAGVDVLLSGAANIGCYLLKLYHIEEIAELTDITKYIEDKLVYFCPQTAIEKLTRGISLIFNLPFKQSKKYRFNWQKQLSEEVREINHIRIEKCVNEMINGGIVNPYEIISNFRMMYMCNLVKQGAFESRFGNMRCYSIYSTIVAKEALKIDYMNCRPLGDKKFIKNLICLKSPEISGVGDENHLPSPKNSSKVLYKQLAILDRAIRGDGAHISYKYWKKKNVYKSFLEDMNNDCIWFYKIFNIKDNIGDIKHTNNRLMNSLWDIKRLIDCIETKEYKNF